MKFPIYITEEQIKRCEFEILSKDLYIYLTRYLNNWCEEIDDLSVKIMRKNTLINLSRTISGGKIYTLNVNEWAEIFSEEIAWHDSHFFLILRNLSTIEFIEYVGELINLEYLKIQFVNEALQKEVVSFRFAYSNNKIIVETLSTEEIEKVNLNSEHINIQTLVNRMDNSFLNEDYSGVLHSSASIFETMAKEIVGIDTVQNNTLKQFFERYRKDSNLPEEILNYIIKIYEKRNIIPLAGHGSLIIPEITKQESIILIEMSKSIVRIEYRIQREI